MGCPALSWVSWGPMGTSCPVTNNDNCTTSFIPGKFVSMTETTKKPDLGLLEEDDEFEEFPAEDWEGAEEDKEDLNVWEDNWDDDQIGDDFSVQLRSELEKQGKSADGSEPMKS